MTTFDPTTHILTQVVNFLDTRGIELTLEDLQKNITPISTQRDENKKKKKFVVKPKKQMKFKVKDKENIKPSVFSLFVDICCQHNLLYFQFNDELNWKGPAIKINPDTFNDSIFSKIDIHILYGYGFGILRPKTYEDDTSIKYEKINYNECKIDEEDYELYNSDDESYEENEIIQNTNNGNDSDASEISIELDEWRFEPTNTTYLIDYQTNNVYSRETETFVGKRLDDHNIDFDAKED
jgi:hypothetical protein